MSNELSWRHSATGETVYATIRSAARTMWNGSALEALTVANWGDYDIALAETPASSYFHVGDWPAGLSTPGWYWVDIYVQAGASPDISDTLAGTLYGYWDGTKFEPAGGDVRQMGAGVVSATALGADAITAASISAGALDAFSKIMGVTTSVNAAGTEIKVYGPSGALVATMTKSGTDPIIWTAVYA